jgi:uncharacterized membrane protein YkoI
MKGKERGAIIAAVALTVVIAGGVAVAGATGGDTREIERRNDAQPVTGAAADRARAAGLEAAGGGRVTEVETADDGDEGYEVEVERRDGSAVEVNLDRAFNVVSVENDD